MPVIIRRKLDNASGLDSNKPPVETNLTESLTLTTLATVETTPASLSQPNPFDIIKKSILNKNNLRYPTPQVEKPTVRGMGVRNKTNPPSGRGYRQQPQNPETKYRTIDKILPRVYNDSIRKDISDLDESEYLRYKCLDCRDTKKILVYDSCEYCDGDGCLKCNNTGVLKNYIPCQSCNTKGKFI